MTPNPYEPGTAEHAAYSAGVLKVRCQRMNAALRSIRTEARKIKPDPDKIWELAVNAIDADHEAAQ